MKLAGVIKSLVSVTAFETPVYTDGEDLYVHVLTDGLIEKFSKVNIEKNKLISSLNWRSPERNFSTQDKPYLCFVIKGRTVIAGFREDLGKFLIPLLKTNQISDTAKLTISSFYRLYGVCSILVKKINYRMTVQRKNIKLKNSDFIKPVSNAIESKETLIEAFGTCAAMIDRYDFLKWHDLISLTKTGILFYGFKEEIHTFLEKVPQGYIKKFEAGVIHFLEHNVDIIDNQFLNKNKRLNSLLLNSRKHSSEIAERAYNYYETEEHLAHSQMQPDPGVVRDPLKKQNMLKMAQSIKPDLSVELAG